MSNDCDRFRRLKLVVAIENWNGNDSSFFESHLVRCEGCQDFLGEIEATSCALRDSSYLPVVDSNFTERVAFAVGQDRFRRHLATWQPTLIGAITAAIVFASVLQLLSMKPSLQQFSPQGTAIAPERPARIFDTTPVSKPSSETREG